MLPGAIPLTVNSSRVVSISSDVRLSCGEEVASTITENDKESVWNVAGKQVVVEIACALTHVMHREGATADAHAKRTPLAALIYCCGLVVAPGRNRGDRPANVELNVPWRLIGSHEESNAISQE